MREIKFRAWDGEKVFDPIIRFDPFVKLAPHTLLTDREGGKWINDYELMQYTGLKDKNGVEIYEGDILEGRAGNYVVKFVGCCFKKQRGEMPISLDNDSSEVIGNIHENKGLLEND